MTSNQWDNRATSGFYTFIEDQMFGPNRRNIQSVRMYTNSIIRRYGAIWEPFEDENRVRMYLYEPVEFGNDERNLLEVNSVLKLELATEKVKAMTCLTLQHHFAEDDGTIRDLVQVWEHPNKEPIFSITETIACDKFLRVTHFFDEARTPFDYHVRIALKK